jgi:hypothetical protein
VISISWVSCRGSGTDESTCEGFSAKTDDFDPYGFELVTCGQTGKNYFVSSGDTNDRVRVGDLPAEKR